MNNIPSQQTSEKKVPSHPSRDGLSTRKGSTESAPVEAKWISVVEEKVRALRFGIVQITIHNGKVVQIDSTERTRLEIES